MPKGFKNNNNLEIVRSKFNKKQTRKIMETALMANWAAKAHQICEELRSLSQAIFGNNKKYVWMVGENPTYFIQYQIDSYAIMKGYNKVLLVWKPKFIEYPSLVKMPQFGDNPKTIKSIIIERQETYGEMSQHLEEKIIEYLQKIYGLSYFSTEEQEFETKLVTEVKNYVSRISKLSFWHCILDDHGVVDVSTRGTIYIRIRIRGVREKYDKDLIVFSQKGEREFMFKGKKMQILSFLGMLLIFMAVISCPDNSSEGICLYKDQMLVAGAAIMMGLMGLRISIRNKNKKEMEHKLSQLSKKQ